MQVRLPNPQTHTTYCQVSWRIRLGACSVLLLKVSKLSKMSKVSKMSKMSKVHAVLNSLGETEEVSSR